MEITYVVIVGIVTYILGAITKVFVDSIPNKYSVASGLICYFTNVEPDLLTSLVLCLTAASAAGGAADLFQTKKSI